MSFTRREIGLDHLLTTDQLRSPYERMIDAFFTRVRSRRSERWQDDVTGKSEQWLRHVIGESADVSRTICPLCGAFVEHRVGVKHPIHLVRSVRGEPRCRPLNSIGRS